MTKTEETKSTWWMTRIIWVILGLVILAGLGATFSGSPSQDRSPARSSSGPAPF